MSDAESDDRTSLSTRTQPEGGPTKRTSVGKEKVKIKEISWTLGHSRVSCIPFKLPSGCFEKVDFPGFWLDSKIPVTFLRKERCVVGVTCFSETSLESSFSGSLFLLGHGTSHAEDEEGDGRRWVDRTLEKDRDTSVEDVTILECVGNASVRSERVTHSSPTSARAREKKGESVCVWCDVWYGACV